MRGVMLKAPKNPCGSCPYRKDVAPGIWHRDEYAKLPPYDADTPSQPFGLFMCHQRDGCICGAWLLTHDRDHLLALRFAGRHLDPSVWNYSSTVEVFASGAEAAAHGTSGIESPSKAARRKIDNLLKRRVV